jgi:hypothetical protein
MNDLDEIKSPAYQSCYMVYAAPPQIGPILFETPLVLRLYRGDVLVLATWVSPQMVDGQLYGIGVR